MTSVPRTIIDELSKSNEAATDTAPISVATNEATRRTMSMMINGDYPKI
jgi:hypothetical protein